MIITTPKSWDEIKLAIERWNLHKLIVVSCGGCAAKCGTGGTEGLEKLLSFLKTLDLKILASMVIQEPCDLRNLHRDFQYVDEEINQTDGFVVASCGIGAQVIGDYFQKPVVITTNTIMMGETIHLNEYSNRCVACGHCILNETGGICPITLCPKSMLNGPCGGMFQGKCEVDNYQNDCAWVQIYNRLEKLGKSSLFAKIREPQDWNLRRRINLNLHQERKFFYSIIDHHNENQKEESN
ncbi:MAG: methylenetetrahydrofolate reductase C-terminal domain-containing protein [Candidatus Lokiarchaeota archaeon]|nr:methylenetetrahydrofolate reductase C-terminal domain-containing protein [Candidatus Harpocratesius repetitus]